MRARSDKHCGFALPRGFIECRTPECEITSPITRVPFYRHLVWKACLIIRKAIDSVNYRKDSDRAQSITSHVEELPNDILKILTHTFFIILFINPRTSFVGSSTRRQPS